MSLKVTFSAATRSANAPRSPNAKGFRVLLVGEKGIAKLTTPKLATIARNNHFTAKQGELLTLPESGILLAGIGKPATSKAGSKATSTEPQGNIQSEQESPQLTAEKLGAKICRKLNELKQTKAKVLGDENADYLSVALGAFLASYNFNKYLTKQKQKPTLKELEFLTKDAAKLKPLWREQQKISEGVFITRNLVNEPSNVIYPLSLAKRAKALTKLGLKVEVLSGAKLKGMGALLGVAQGSSNPPQVVVMRWMNGGAKAPLAFVGKGVTFDTGGISIKPAGGMEEMKSDMGGAAVVIGLMAALAGRRAKVNAVGVVGLVENMVSGNAQRPGDIVTSLSGKTIEVLNTDAEGRLVLADVLHYTLKRFKPRYMVNLATLTGAIIVALGEEYAGLFSNNDKLAITLTQASHKVGEKLWRMPMGKVYDKMLDSPVADIQNITNKRGAGSITAAQFLKRFVDKTPWAHLDIAGVTLMNRQMPTAPKGASGFGVRLLDQFTRIVG